MLPGALALVRGGGLHLFVFLDYVCRLWVSFLSVVCVLCVGEKER